MFTLIQNYRTLLMMCVENGFEGGPVIVEETPEAEVSPEQAEAIATVKEVTRAQLEDLKAVSEYLEAGNTVQKGAPKEVTTDVQEIFVHLGTDIWDFGPNSNGVDGDFGGTMNRVTSAFQAENGLPETGVVDKTTYDVLLMAANVSNMADAEQNEAQAEVPAVRPTARPVQVEEMTEAELMEVRDFDIFIPEQSEINDYSREALSEMNKYEKEAVQRDINAVLAGMGEELIAVDGWIWPISRWAMEEIGVYNSETQEYNFVKLVRLAQVARNDSQLDRSLDGVDQYQALRLEADDILSTISSGISEEELNQVVSELAVLTDVWDDDGDGNDDWTEENKTQRFSMAQYVTDRASRMVDAGTLANTQASTIVLGVLAQEKFESKPGREAISRMVNNTVDDINALSRNEAGQEIGSSFSASEAINAIVRSNEPMSMQVSLDRGYFRVAGNNYDVDRSEDMYIVTGNSAQRISMRDTAGFDLTDVAVVGNTIVGLMNNGCEWNVIYIPLDVNTVPRPPRPTPRVNPPRLVPPTPITPETPETPLDEYERCEWNDYVHSVWDGRGTFNPFDDVLINRTIITRNDPQCRPKDRDPDPTPNTPATTTTTGGGGGTNEVGGGVDDEPDTTTSTTNGGFNPNN